MASFSGLGIGLSFVFGCIFLGLVAELYYMLWWKKKINGRRGIEDHYSKYAKELSYLFCWKTPTSSIDRRSQQIPNSVINPYPNGDGLPDPELGFAKDKGYGEEGVESELMRVHNLCGPPRFLFTIKEETKEDLESDDGKSRGERSRKGSRTKSLSDFLFSVDTPVLTPVASPRMKAHPFDFVNQNGFNPLFESVKEAEMNRLRSSPPPKLKFLRDAEEKLMRRLMEETEKRGAKNGGFGQDSSDVGTEEREGSFIRLIACKNKEHCHSTASSQVLPLASSPSKFRAFDNSKAPQQ